jgi:5-methyltetrahydropteroyltriglutamate--homocysteine methyltransferase
MLAKTLTDRHYGSPAKVAMAIADVLRRQVERIPADVIQIDEANISGHPEDSDWAAEALNHVLGGIQTTRAVHICFGNYGGQSIQKGFWKSLLPFLNSLHVHHYVLEFARRGYEELPALVDLDGRIGIGLSVVDIKDNEVESADLIASRIENACRIVGEQRIPYIHPDCGFWMLTRSVADRKIRALVEGRDLFYNRKKETGE